MAYEYTICQDEARAAFIPLLSPIHGDTWLNPSSGFNPIPKLKGG
jgi:hypothetical protein